MTLSSDGWDDTPIRAVLVPLLWEAIARLWATGFTLAGRLQRPTVPRCYPVGGGTVLVLAPHPDDEVAGCGATLLQHREHGDRVIVLYVTDGRGSRAGGLRPPEMADRREREARTAAARLGVELEWMALAELGWESASLTERMLFDLEEFRPDIIYAPSPVDYHPVHRNVARALAAALTPTCADRKIRIYEVQVPLTPLLINLLVPSGIFVWQRRAALAAYETQEQAIRPPERLRRYNAAYWGEAVECFWEVSVGQYCYLVENSDQPERETPFRGLRPRPILDPLCYLRGWRRRRQLARMVRLQGTLEGRGMT